MFERNGTYVQKPKFALELPEEQSRRLVTPGRRRTAPRGLRPDVARMIESGAAEFFGVPLKIMPTRDACRAEGYREFPTCSWSGVALLVSPRCSPWAFAHELAHHVVSHESRRSRGDFGIRSIDDEPGKGLLSLGFSDTEETRTLAFQVVLMDSILETPNMTDPLERLGLARWALTSANVNTWRDEHYRRRAILAVQWLRRNGLLEAEQYTGRWRDVLRMFVASPVIVPLLSCHACGRRFRDGVDGRRGAVYCSPECAARRR